MKTYCSSKLRVNGLARLLLPHYCENESSGFQELVYSTCSRFEAICVRWELNYSTSCLLTHYRCWAEAHEPHKRYTLLMKQQREGWGGDAAYIKLMKWEKKTAWRRDEWRQTAAMQMKSGERNERNRGKTPMFNSRLLLRRFEESQMLDTKGESEKKRTK